MKSYLTVEQVRKCVLVVYYEGYNDGYLNRGCHYEETDWQAITDELNSQAAITLEEDKANCIECCIGTYKYEHKLGEVIDGLIKRVDELTDERYRYKLQCEQYKARIGKLESLIKDMDRDCRICKFPCYTEKGKCGILQRIDELFEL